MQLHSRAFTKPAQVLYDHVGMRTACASWEIRWRVLHVTVGETQMATAEPIAILDIADSFFRCSVRFRERFRDLSPEYAGRVGTNLGHKCG